MIHQISQKFFPRAAPVTVKVAKRTPCPPLPRAGEGWGEGNREWRDCFHVPGWRERHERLGEAERKAIHDVLPHGRAQAVVTAQYARDERAIVVGDLDASLAVLLALAMHKPQGAEMLFDEMKTEVVTEEDQPAIPPVTLAEYSMTAILAGRVSQANDAGQFQFDEQRQALNERLDRDRGRPRHPTRFLTVPGR